MALDTIESLFAGLSNEAIVRAELRRLFRWLKAKGSLRSSRFRLRPLQHP